MKIHKDTTIQPVSNPVISIGVFDGVHRGHAAIFDRVRSRSNELGGESIIVTFRPHPRLVLGDKSETLKYLTTFDEKSSLISRHGIDHLIVLAFTKEFAKLPPCDFIKQYLVDRVGLRHLVFGFNHHFGHNREGNFENLKSCAVKYGFSIEQIEPVVAGNCQISSSAIREAISLGNVRRAAQLLSYPYSLQGKIVAGRQLGRSMGYPTANLDPEDEHKLVPANGVYAVRVRINKQDYMGMMNIGFRPTVDKMKGNKSFEVHIMDFAGDVYNNKIRVTFIDRIRDEINFSSLEKLREQLERDKIRAVEILS